MSEFFVVYDSFVRTYNPSHTCPLSGKPFAPTRRNNVEESDRSSGRAVTAEASPISPSDPVQPSHNSFPVKEEAVETNPPSSSQVNLSLVSLLSLAGYLTSSRVN